MNGSETTGLTAVGVGELTGGVHGVPCAGGGAEIAGGGIHAVLTCAGGECAEINPGAADEAANVEGDAEAATLGGCHATPGGKFVALRISSRALMNPYVRQPINMQISATNSDIGKSNPNPLNAV